MARTAGAVNNWASMSRSSKPAQNRTAAAASHCRRMSFFIAQPKLSGSVYSSGASGSSQR